MEEKEKVLAKNTFFLYLMQICNYVFPLLTFPYITRILGANRYGVVVFGNAVMQYFSMFLEFGFILSATHQCSLARDEKNLLSHITIGVIQAKAILAFFSLIILIILCSFVNSFKEEKVFFFIYFAGTVLNILLPDYLFRGIEKMSILTYRVIFSKLIYTIMIFLFVRNEKRYILIPVATITSNIVSVILTWYAIFKDKYITFTKVSFKDTIKYIKDASTFFLSRLAVSLYTTLNTVLLKFNVTNEVLGQFGAANSLTNMCRSMLNPIADSIYPYMVKNKNYKLVKKLILVFEPIVILGCLIMYFIAPLIIRIFCGPGYDSAINILRAMLPLIIISLPTYLCGYPVLGALGKTNVANYSVIVGSFFHVVGLIVLYLIDWLGPISISLLTFITEIIVFLIRLITILFSIKKNE